MSYKPVDTAIVMVVGPCIDDTDFKSLEEAIAYDAAGMDVSLIVEKTDGTSAVTAITLTTGGTSDWTHKDGGYYEIEITAAQNAEEGIAYLRGVCTGVLPFESPRYDIEKANIYDSLRKGTDNLQVDVTQLLGTAWLAPGVAGTPDVNAKQLGGTAQTGRDIGANVLLSSGTGAGQLDFTSGIVKSNLTQILAHLLTQTGTQLADGFEKFFDVGTPTGTVNSLPAGAADAANGLPVSDAGGLDLDTKLANTNEITAARMGVLTDWINGGRLDLILDIIATGTTTDIPVKLLKYIQLLARSDAAIATDNVTELTAINADGGSGAGDFSNQLDAVEALRDRGDSAWTTGAGGSDRLLMVDTTIATLASQTSFTLTAGSADNNAYNNCTIIIEDVSTAAQKAVGIISAYTGATKTITLKYDPAIFTMATTDKVYILAENALKSTLSNRQLNVSADGSVASVTATGLDLILKDSTFALAIADAIWDEILTGVTHNIANSAGRRVREVGAFAIESGTAQAGNGHSITLAAGASATDGIYNRNLIVLTDNTGAGQTRTIVDYDGTTKVCVIDRDWRISPDATTSYQIVPDDTPLTVDHGVAQGGTSTTITIRDYASNVDDAYLCNIVTIIAGKGRGQARLVGAYNGTTKVVTICGDNWVETPDATSIYVMMPYGTTCTSCIGTTALGLINTECDTALTDYDPPTRTEATADKGAIITEVDANETKIDTMQGNVTDILTDTGTTIPGTITTLQADSTAIKAKTDALPSGIEKNVALPFFDFYMLLEDGLTAAPGKTITSQIRKDNGAFTAITNVTSEVGSGLYAIASGFTQAEMNADKITLKFTATACKDTIIIIYTT